MSESIRPSDTDDANWDRGTAFILIWVFGSHNNSHFRVLWSGLLGVDLM